MIPVYVDWRGMEHRVRNSLEELTTEELEQFHASAGKTVKKSYLHESIGILVALAPLVALLGVDQTTIREYADYFAGLAIAGVTLGLPYSLYHCFRGMRSSFQGGIAENILREREEKFE